LDHRHIHPRWREGSVTVAVSNYAVLIDSIWSLVITIAGFIELLNHETSTIT
jgi:hypothetical protein